MVLVFSHTHYAITGVGPPLQFPRLLGTFSYNLATVSFLSHHVAVMYLGKIVEYAEADKLFADPKHPYTKLLISAAKPALPGDIMEKIDLEKEQPSPLNLPTGCRFHPRCPEAGPNCSRIEPPLKEVAPSHYVRCQLY